MADSLTVQKRGLMFALAAQTGKALEGPWREFDPTRTETFHRFLMPAAALVAHNQRVAADIGLNYYVAMRKKHVGAAPSRPPLPDPSPLEQIVKSLTAVGLGGVLIGYKMGRTPDEAKRFAFERVKRAAGRHVVNGARDAVRTAADVDPRGRGFIRVTTGTCDFCEELAASGEFRPEQEFNAHDGCMCVAEPLFQKPANVFRDKADLAPFTGEGQPVEEFHGTIESLTNEAAQLVENAVPDIETKWNGKVDQTIRKVEKLYNARGAAMLDWDRSITYAENITQTFRYNEEDRLHIAIHEQFHGMSEGVDQWTYAQRSEFIYSDKAYRDFLGGSYQSYVRPQFQTNMWLEEGVVEGMTRTVMQELGYRDPWRILATYQPYEDLVTVLEKIRTERTTMTRRQFYEELLRTPYLEREAKVHDWVVGATREIVEDVASGEISVETAEERFRRLKREASARYRERKKAAIDAAKRDEARRKDEAEKLERKRAAKREASRRFRERQRQRQGG